jgi:hypothetical protein
MLKLKQTFTAALLAVLMLSGMANAQSIDTSKLTTEERAALETVFNQMAEDKSTATTVIEAIQDINVSSEAFAKWAQAGTEAGKAVSNFTKEIGATANEFLDSFPGKAIFLIMFMNYGGGALATFFLDIAIFVCLTPFFLYFINRVFRRFVLHQSYDGRKPKGERWSFLPGRGHDTAREETIEIDGAKMKVSTTEAVFGWVFIVVTTMVYLSYLWPTWTPS